MNFKSTAKILVIKNYLDPLLELFAKYGHHNVGVTINGNRAIINFEAVEPDPIWLLDLRRSAIPYLWLWGDKHNWRFFNASSIHRGKATVIENLSSLNDPACITKFVELSLMFTAHKFDSDLVESAYDAQKRNSMGQALLA
ncbi:TPA: hypothetical protein OXT18_001778 [Acinetobacter baumannii]|nr:hypothetical protein [Acinetobacter baumannii]